MNTPVVKQVDEALGDIVRNETASTAKADDSPDSKASQDTVVMDDPNYIPPKDIDILLSDIDSDALHGDLSQLLQEDYLSVLSPETEAERASQKTVQGKILERNTRFIINIPCRHKSQRNNPTSPRAALPYRNMFFIVDTGSPHSYLCKEAMEALLDSNNGNPVPRSIIVDLITGYTSEFHLSPHESHYSDVNIIGGSVLRATKLVSDGINQELSLKFPTLS